VTDTHPAVQDQTGSSLWDSLSLTKFRAPRQRRDLVARAALVQRLQQLLQRYPLTLVCAPAGFGKSTLLLQLAQCLPRDNRVVWLSLDADDNDPNRLFVSLIAALRDIVLRWDIEPTLLATQVRGGGQSNRTIVSVLANALASFDAGHLVLILDDLHNVTDTAALQLLADLVDRLPPSASLILGSRTEPALPLARWRVRDELGQLDHGDLQFDQQDAEALAKLRQSGEESAIPADFVAQALQRTQGWAAGLSLVFGVSSGPLVEHLQSAVDKAASRHLFDFFAQEVLAELPTDLADFIVHCSVLPELNPTLCEAVTGRHDVRAVLEDLYRRNTFLTTLDETVPVLRFHDLFAEFLQNRLERLHPGLVSELHARAARAEPVPLRAVNHWLKAQCWEDAVAEIDSCLEPLLAEGSTALVERWITQLPAAWMERPEVARLQAMCAWSGWDFGKSFHFLEKACAGFRAQGNESRYLQHLALLPRTCNAIGRLAEADRMLAQIDALSLEPRWRVNCLGTQAWQAMAMGRSVQVAGYLSQIATAAERDPSLLSPAIDDAFNSFMFGMPNVYAPMQRLRALCNAQLGNPGTSWQIVAFAHTPWLEFWRGNRAGFHAAVRTQALMQIHLAVPALLLNTRQTEAWEAAATGDAMLAADKMQQGLVAMETHVPALMATWHRSTSHTIAHFFWMAQDLETMQAMWPYLSTPTSSVEWPFLDTARAHLRGQIALLEGDLAAAETALLEAETLQQSWPMPTFFGDARITLAWLHLQQRKPDQAWQVFVPVLERCLHEDSLGLLLTSPAFAVDPLLALIPQDLRADVQPLLERLSDWRRAQPAAQYTMAPLTPVLQELSEREREVLAMLAAGDSNKLIARALDLSPHTVKRHVANILAKLDCASRGQAAALWRRFAPE
jgi:LuxR family maltose regulon positive regulatory protein